MVNEDGSFVRGPGADGGDGDEGNEEGDGEEDEPAPEPPAVKKRAPQFDASVLKGRPLF